LLLSSLTSTTSGRRAGRRRSGAWFFTCLRSAAAATSTSTSSRSSGWGQRQGYQLCCRSGGCVCAHRQKDELTSLMDVAHWDSCLRSGHWDLRNILTGLLVVGVEQRIRSIAGEEQRFRHEKSDLTRGARPGNSQSLKCRVIFDVG